MIWSWEKKLYQKTTRLNFYIYQSMTSRKPTKVEKQWGHEVWLANNKDEDYCGKILYIKEDCSTSMHFHVNKHESFYILEGKLQIDILNTVTAKTHSKTIKKGEVFCMHRVTPHKLIAKDGPVKFIETSTYHEDSDSYRVWK
jgi:mannose-6-phosphate isomerase-like protein (cupin superfamily)